MNEILLATVGKRNPSGGPVDVEIIVREEGDFGPESYIITTLAAADNTLYLACGNERPSNARTNDVWEFDLITRKWVDSRRVAGTNRSNNSNIVVGDYLYIAGGEPAQTIGNGNFLIYNRVTRANERPETKALPRNAFSFPIVQYDNKLWIFGGYFRPTVSSLAVNDLMFVYNITTKQFTNISLVNKIPARVGSLAVTVDDYMYILGGYGYPSTIRYDQEFWRYDFANNEYLRLTDLPENIVNPVFGNIGKRIIVYGGIRLTDNVYSTNVYEYDIIANDWILVRDDAPVLTNAPHVSHNGKIYAYGGMTATGVFNKNIYVID